MNYIQSYINYEKLIYEIASKQISKMEKNNRIIVSKNAHKSGENSRREVPIKK